MLAAPVSVMHLTDPGSLPSDLEALREIYKEYEKHLDKLEKEERSVCKQKMQAKRSLTNAKSKAQMEDAVPPKPAAPPPTRFSAEFATAEEALAEKNRLEQELQNVEADTAALADELKESRRMSLSIADTAATRAPEEDAAADGTQSDGESWTSEDEKLVAEMHELERLVQQAEQQNRSPRPSGSAHSFCTAPDSVASGPKTCASLGSSPLKGSAAVPALNVPSTGSYRSDPAQGEESHAGDGSNSEATPGKGIAPDAKGSGKGKGKAKAPPPPPAAPRKVGAPSPKAAPTPKSSRLVCLHWKVSQEPEPPNPAMPSWLAQVVQSGPFEDCARLDGKFHNLNIPDAPQTLFNPLAELHGPTAEETRSLLEQFFEKCPSSAWAARAQAEAVAQANGAGEPKRTSELDPTKLRMLGVVIQKFKMELSRREDSSGSAVGSAEGSCAGEAQTDGAARPADSAQQQVILSIKRGVLHCDYEAVRLETLSILRTVLRQHEKAERPVSRFVERHGEAALVRLECPEEHRLVFELSKVPQVNERLECMIFHITYEDSVETCRHNLSTLSKALLMLNKKRDTIRRCFVTALRLGQSLSRQSVPGFQLSTLEKLSQTKSSKYPKLSMLHFVLALMSKEDASNLFNDADISLLQSAKTLGTDKVVQESLELARGLFGVQNLCKDGQYTPPSTGEAVTMERRRMSHVHPSCEQEAAIDTDDRFHEVMERFVADNLSGAKDIVEEAFDTILTYKELAVYFDDLKSVYPPPKSDRDPTQDLCDIFHRFAEDIRRHRDEVDRERLRDLLVANGPGEAEACFARQVSSQREALALPGV